MYGKCWSLIPPRSELQCGTCWESSSPAICFFHGRGGFFPPSCLLLSSLLGCIGIPASTVLSKRFCAILLVQWARGRWEGRRRSWYNAVFQHLSHGFSPYPLWRSERELCGTHHRESLFQESVEASVGFAGYFHGKQSAVRQMCARTWNLLNLILSRQPYVTERQWLVRQNRIIIVFFSLVIWKAQTKQPELANWQRVICTHHKIHAGGVCASLVWLHAALWI